MGFLSKLKKQRPAEPASALPLHLHNTLSKQKETFAALSEKTVKMYNCGPTVYDFQHIGNLRPYVFADILRRILEYNGHAVEQVINITNVGHLTSDADEGEDKMTKALLRESKRLTLRNMYALGEKYAKAFIADLEELNIKTEHIEFPRASDYIGEQIALVETLEEKGYTYRLDDGIYFDTAKYLPYGALGNIDLDKLKEGARIEVSSSKQHPADFALWKFSSGMGWNSPWGKGFPGWHLECTAMVFTELGRQIDIHTGGVDHIPIHHNNEIAQAESVTQKPFVRYWLHNAFITIEGSKIAKSVGNTIYLRNLKDRDLTPLAYRYWLLTAHYRSPINFTWNALEGAQTALARLHRHFIEELGERKGAVVASYQERFRAAVNDDVDTPKALSILWELVRDESVGKKDKRSTLMNFDRVLGLGLREGHEKLESMLEDEEKRLKVHDAPKAVQKLLEEREQARKDQRWEDADQLRQKIEQKDYRIEDTDAGPKLRKGV